MNCKETEEVIHGYLDGELDLVRSLEVEQHLTDCPVCERTYREMQSLRTAIAKGSLGFNAPNDLKRRVRSAVRQASRAEGRAEGGQRRWNWNWLTLLGPVATAALVLVIALPIVTRHSGQLVDEIVSAHVRSVMDGTSHLIDMPSSDQHTVKPWFIGKLPFAPPVPDLAAQGFPLVGGRLDYIGEHPVAALVYQRRKHLINLFVWPGQEGSSRSLRTRQGYNVVHWDQGGMSCWAISDVNMDDLKEFGRLVRGS